MVVIMCTIVISHAAICYVIVHLLETVETLFHAGVQMMDTSLHQ